MIGLLLLLLAGEAETLTRTTYDLVLVTETRSVSMRMVVNHLDEDHLSISCRKAPSGTIFTYWATPERNVLKIPRAEVMYEGPAAQAFRLFPDGPLLARAAWLRLLSGHAPDALTKYRFRALEDGWFQVADPREGLTIRWRERNRRELNSWRDTVFQPTFPIHYRLEALENMVDSWHPDDLD